MFEPLLCCLPRPYGCTLIPFHQPCLPQIWEAGSLVEWTWCYSITVKADIHLRLLHTSILIYKVFQPLVCCLRDICMPLHRPHLPHIWKCHYVMFEADIHLWPLPTSIRDIYKVFEPSVCCLKGIWVHPFPFTSIPSKLAPDLGI